MPSSAWFDTVPNLCLDSGEIWLGGVRAASRSNQPRLRQRRSRYPRADGSHRTLAIARELALIGVLSGHRDAEQDGTVPTTTRRRAAAAWLAPERVRELVSELLSDDVHTARALVRVAALGVDAIGRGLAEAMGLDEKHAIKQIEWLLSNTNINVWAWFEGSATGSSRRGRRVYCLPTMMP